MNRKVTLHRVHLVYLVVPLLAVSASAQRRPRASPAAAKTTAARMMVQGTYEETFKGATSDGILDGNLVIKFEAARWVKVTTNEVGNAEFSELEGAPVPYASGTVTYNGLVKGSASGGESYQATSNFLGRLEVADVVLTNPEYSNTGSGLKMTVYLNPKLKGKCHLEAIRNGERTTSETCDNGSIFVISSMDITDNDDPGKTADAANKASFSMELIVEPEIGPAGEAGTSTNGVDEAARARRELEKLMGQTSGQASGNGDAGSGDAGLHAWRGAVTNGSKEAGFKILLNKTKELPSDDHRGKMTRTLNFTATITPGIPK